MPHANGDVTDKGNNGLFGHKGTEKADVCNGEVDEETDILKRLLDARRIHVSSFPFYVHSCL